jgi:hypothetical protein
LVPSDRATFAILLPSCRLVKTSGTLVAFLAAFTAIEQKTLPNQAGESKIAVA